MRVPYQYRAASTYVVCIECISFQDCPVLCRGILIFMRKLTILFTVLLAAVFTQGVALPYQSASPTTGVQQDSGTSAKSNRSRRARDNSGAAADSSSQGSNGTREVASRHLLWARRRI